MYALLNGNKEFDSETNAEKTNTCSCLVKSMQHTVVGIIDKSQSVCSRLYGNEEFKSWRNFGILATINSKILSTCLLHINDTCCFILVWTFKLKKGWTYWEQSSVEQVFTKYREVWRKIQNEELLHLISLQLSNK